MSTARSSSSRLLPLLAALLLSLLLPATARAAEDLEPRMLEVASGLRCPVCQNLSVADSTSDMAREMRALILDELKAGKSPDEIRAYFVEKYGQWILLSPTPRGVGLVVWVLPAAATGAGLGIAAWALRRWTRRRPATARGAAPADGDHGARIRALAAADELPGDLSSWKRSSDQGRSIVSRTLTAQEAQTIEVLRELEFDYRAGKLSRDDYDELAALYERRAAEAAEAAAAQAAARSPAEQKLARLEAAFDAADVEPHPRRWRWAAAGVFLVGFGMTIGFFLTASIRARGDGSVTGDALTGTGAGPAVSASREVGTLLAEGQQAIAREDFKRAAAVFRRVLELEPSEPTAHAQLGLILLRAGHAEQALRSFDRALATDPISAPALWGRGLVLYESMGRPAEALHAWETLLTLRISEEDRTHVQSMVAEARARTNERPAAPGPAPAKGSR